MAASNLPIFAQNPKTWTCSVSAALTSINTAAPGNTVLLGTAGSDGEMITKVSAIPKATTTVGCLHLFLRKPTDAANTRRLLPYSALVAAYTYATTTENKPTHFSDITEETPLRLEAGDELYAGESVANNVEFTALLATFTAA